MGRNFALGFSAPHTLYMSLVLVPKPLQAEWLIRAGLTACAVFYISISAIALHQR